MNKGYEIDESTKELFLLDENGEREMFIGMVGREIWNDLADDGHMHLLWNKKNRNCQLVEGGKSYTFYPTGETLGLMKIAANISNNNWRKMHRIPMMRRSIKEEQRKRATTI
jgi:hypothetical protein